MEKDNEQKFEKFINDLDSAKIVTPEGLKVSGMGILIKTLEELQKKVDKIESYLYWLEKRDKEKSEKQKT